VVDEGDLGRGKELLSGQAGIEGGLREWLGEPVEAEVEEEPQENTTQEEPAESRGRYTPTRIQQMTPDGVDAALV